MNGLTHTTFFRTALATLLVLALCAHPAAAADYVVDFEDGTKPAYASGSVTLNGISWNMTEALIGTDAADWKNGLKSARLRGYSASAVSMEADKADGIGEVSFSHRRYGTDAQVPWRVEVSVDAGGSWTPVGTEFTPSDAVGTFNATVSQAGPARIRVVAVNAGASNRRANIDDILLSDFGTAVSNRPPNMVTVTDKNVPEGGDLLFLVSAADPDNADAVTLSAQNLPPGAMFAETTATPAVSNVFAWPAASPAGIYNVTFLAVDKDGTNSQQVAITVASANTQADLLISEYGEGSSNNKYIELFNGTGAPINLGGYSLRKQANGAGPFGNTLSLSGSLADGDTFVIVNSSAAAELLALADLTSSSQALTFNGNDAVALYRDENPLDVVGVVDNSADWGKDVTLIRKRTVSVPRALWAPEEWDSRPADDWSDVGSHTFDGGSNRPPVFAAISDLTITRNDPLAFLVTAIDPDGTDTVTLWATNLPPVAIFTATSEIGAASNVCTWTDTSTAGVWTVTFYAADKDGTNSRTVHVEITDPGIATDLIVSEYGEGANNNKYIEIFNGTGRSINLGDYSLRKSVNGAAEFTDSLTLVGTLPQNRTYVVINALAAPALQAKADLSTRSSVMDFNGNDPVALFKGNDPLDVVGLFGGVDWGKDVTLIRKSEITAPVNIYDPDQWFSRPIDSWDNIGFHNMDGLAAQSNTPPIIAALTDRFAYLGETVQFTVGASDPLDGDEITLSAITLPPGATFSPAVGVGNVSSLFTWENASPVGVYTSRFAAVDKDGTNVQSVTIEVLAALTTNQTRVVHFNEVRYNDAGSGPDTPDNKEFVELIAHAGVNLEGCTLVHYNGSASQDGGIWTFTFPTFVVPDAGITDTNGMACGFVLLSQPDGELAASADFLLPTDPSSTTTPPASLQNGPDGLVLYDPEGAVLDAIAWGTFTAQTDPGDLLVDDPGPGVISRDLPPTSAAYLHMPPYNSNDNSPQAPNDVIGDTGQNWVALNASPGALNFNQQNGLLILTIQTPPPHPSSPA